MHLAKVLATRHAMFDRTRRTTLSPREPRQLALLVPSNGSGSTRELRYIVVPRKRFRAATACVRGSPRAHSLQVRFALTSFASAPASETLPTRSERP